MSYDYTAYPVHREGKPQRESTSEELTIWMNKLSTSIGAGVHHWITEKRIHFLHLNVDDKLVERGIL